ncbi:MAG: DUF2721 domain-containing protein [Bacteroidales bacterium]|nr:DUF2721 domain-containing protein [Bacteroidales bacterium]
MEDFNLITPTLLFSAVSLIMLAYTNRFLFYAQLVRSLKEKFDSGEGPAKVTEAQIRNLRIRLRLTRNMQFFGVGSLLICTLTMFLIFIGLRPWAIVAFGVALILFIISLALSVWEITLSTKALNIHLQGLGYR